MLDLYLLALFTILITEYGLQTRKRAVDRFRGKWPRWRTAFRAFLWFVVWSWMRGLGPVRLAVLAGLAFLLGEGFAWFLRRRVQQDFDQGHPYGRPRSHALVLLIPLLIPSMAWLFVPGWLAGPPLRASEYLSAGLIIVNVVIAMFCWATLVTVSVVELVRPGQVPDQIVRTVGGGEIIGILERLLTLALVATGGMAAVGFTVAAKAAARFPRFKDSTFAEYFLIGTLCSIGLGTLAGLLLAWSLRAI